MYLSEEEFEEISWDGFATCAIKNTVKIYRLLLIIKVIDFIPYSVSVKVMLFVVRLK